MTDARGASGGLCGVAGRLRAVGAAVLVDPPPASRLDPSTILRLRLRMVPSSDRLRRFSPSPFLRNGEETGRAAVALARQRGAVRPMLT